MATSFNVCVFRPDGLIFSSAFSEVAESYLLALKALGYPAVLTENHLRADAVNILFGVNLFCNFKELRLPPNVIIVNLEQYYPESDFFSPGVLAAYREHTVWDYSHANVLRFHHLGHLHTYLVPIGSVPEMARIPDAVQDIDVLHYGWPTPRRLSALEEMRSKGLNVVNLEALFGKERDEYIARAKIIVQIRADDFHKIFEVVRASYLMVNGKAILSEIDGTTEIEPDIATGVFLVPSSGLAAAAVRLCADSDLRHKIAARGKAVMGNRPLVRYLAAAIRDLPKSVFPDA